MSSQTETVQIPFREMSLDGLLLKPAAARWLYVMAHGAGAGMHHPFLEAMASRLSESGIATLRFNFPYLQRGRRLPDREPELLSALEAVWGWAHGHLPDTEIIAGGKSMGGRMSSILMSRGGWDWVRGLVFLGFPLHPAKKPGISRAGHLQDVPCPMLFLQGTRDALADKNLMDEVGAGLADVARLHYIDGADHGFEVLRQSGRTANDVREELRREVVRFCQMLTER